MTSLVVNNNIETELSNNLQEKILPNLKKGLLASLFLSFSFLLGEFVFANILVGTRYETLQIYLYNMRQTSGHFTSALVITYFLFIFLCTWLASRFSRGNHQ